MLQYVVPVTVRSCARCGQDHEDLPFRVLHNASDEWRWWSMCPTKQQPILIKVANDDPRFHYRGP